jgi:hypothetical protein
MLGAAHVVTTSVGMCDVDLRYLCDVILKTGTAKEKFEGHGNT